MVVRRYRCRGCGAVCQVVPTGVHAGHRYLWSAVVLALTLWSVRRLPASEVRRRISPYSRVGFAVTGWASLRRWARTYGHGDGTLRARAQRFVFTLATRSPLTAQRFAIEPRIYAASLHPS